MPRISSRNTVRTKAQALAATVAGWVQVDWARDPLGFIGMMEVTNIAGAGVAFLRTQGFAGELKCGAQAVADDGFEQAPKARSVTIVSGGGGGRG